MDADGIIERLGLQPHPEGGHYAETHAERVGEERGAVTAIYFLLRQGERSRWHRVDATEIWLWHAGAALDLSIHDGVLRPVRLGPGLDQGERPQAIVPAFAWQQAQSRGDYSLVSCVVAPGFTFAGFELPDDPTFTPEGARD